MYMIESIKQTFYDNPNYVVVLFFVITIAYFINPFIGLGLSILSIVTAHKLYYTQKYDPSSVGKVYLVYVTSFLLFAKICNLLPFTINTTLRVLLFLNVICLATTTIHNPYVYSPINDYVLTALLVVLSFCTPSFLITNQKAVMKNGFFPNSLYVVFFTIILSYYYIHHHKFGEHILLLLGSLVIPMIGHFVNNSWLELRALWLCMIGLFELVDKRFYGY